MRFANLKPKDLEGDLSRYLVVLPVGTTEQHGEHLPFGTDFFAPEHLAGELEKTHRHLLILPTISYGYDLKHALHLGSIALDYQTFRQTIYGIVQSVLEKGFTRLLIINGHMPNLPLIVSAMDEAMLQHAKVNPNIRGLALSWWDIIRPGFVQEHFPHQDAHRHAAALESAVILDMLPDLVDVQDSTFDVLDMPKGYSVSPSRLNYLSSVACYGDPKSANPTNARLLVEHIVERLNAIISKEFGSV